MNRLGFGYDAVRAINPRLIYCSISGYGQSGPRAGEAGHDLNYIGNTGLLSLQPGPADRPVVPPALVADIGGGTFPAVINILLALRQREQTGQGCHLDIAMTDTMFTFAWHALAEGFATGRYPDSGTSKLAGGSPRYRLYPTRDGKFVACGALEDHFWAAFTAAIGLDGGAQGRQRESGSDRRCGRQDHCRQDRRGMAAGSGEGRLLRDHRRVAGRGDARSAFCRARSVFREDVRAVGRNDSGLAGADRAGISRRRNRSRSAGWTRVSATLRRASGAASRRPDRRLRASPRAASCPIRFIR